MSIWRTASIAFVGAGALGFAGCATSDGAPEAIPGETALATAQQAATSSAPAFETLVINDSSRPVPTTSVGTTSISGTVTVGNSSSQPVPVAGTVTVANPVTTVTAHQGGGPWVVEFGDTGGNPAHVIMDNAPSTQEIAGSVEVSNFPAMQPISGAVAVSNFPSFPATQAVTVTNVPTVQLDPNGPPLQVQTATQTPLPKTNFAISIGDQSWFGSAQYVVPANQRLVVEEFSCAVVVPPGQIAHASVAGGPTQDIYGTLNLPMIHVGPHIIFANGTADGDLYVGSAMTRQYFEGGSNGASVFISIGRSQTIGTSTGGCTISGYLTPSS